MTSKYSNKKKSLKFVFEFASIQSFWAFCSKNKFFLEKTKKIEYERDHNVRQEMKENSCQ